MLTEIAIRKSQVLSRVKDIVRLFSFLMHGYVDEEILALPKELGGRLLRQDVDFFDGE
jgi:hypothetical protein